MQIADANERDEEAAEESDESEEDLSEDFGSSGKCNYYMAEDVIYVNSIAMAFQVCFGTNRP